MRQSAQRLMRSRRVRHRSHGGTRPLDECGAMKIGYRKWYFILTLKPVARPGVIGGRCAAYNRRFRRERQPSVACDIEVHERMALPF
jgi:hypothetical protein